MLETETIRVAFKPSFSSECTLELSRVAASETVLPYHLSIESSDSGDKRILRVAPDVGARFFDTCSSLPAATPSHRVMYIDGQPHSIGVVDGFSALLTVTMANGTAEVEASNPEQGTFLSCLFGRLLELAIQTLLDSDGVLRLAPPRLLEDLVDLQVEHTIFKQTLTTDEGCTATVLHVDGTLRNKMSLFDELVLVQGKPLLLVVTKEPHAESFLLRATESTRCGWLVQDGMVSHLPDRVEQGRVFASRDKALSWLRSSTTADFLSPPRPPLPASRPTSEGPNEDVVRVAFSPTFHSPCDIQLQRLQRRSGPAQYELTVSAPGGEAGTVETRFGDCPQHHELCFVNEVEAAKHVFDLALAVDLSTIHFSPGLDGLIAFVSMDVAGVTGYAEVWSPTQDTKVQRLLVGLVHFAIQAFCTAEQVPENEPSPLLRSLFALRGYTSTTLIAVNKTTLRDDGSKATALLLGGLSSGHERELTELMQSLYGHRLLVVLLGACAPVLLRLLQSTTNATNSAWLSDHEHTRRQLRNAFGPKQSIFSSWQEAKNWLVGGI